MRIYVEEHFCHDRAKLELPIGVTVITGANGAGKSALAVESIATAVFGKTVRGAPMSTRLASVECDSFYACRERVNKSTKLRFIQRGEASVTHETTTKAQEALEAFLGLDFAAWRRTHLFSAAGLAQFSEATDAERKRLLESLLGLEKFDRALAAARADLQAARIRVTSRASSLAVLRRVMADAETAVAECREALQRAESAPPPEAPREFNGEQLRQATARVEAMRAARDKLMDERRRATDALGRAKRALQNGACQECGRPYDDAPIEELQAAVEQAEAVHKLAVSAVREADTALHGFIAEAEELVAMSRNYEVARHEYLMAEKARASEVKLCKIQLAAAEARAIAADRDLEEAELAEAADVAEAKELEAVEKVLGLKGARTLVLEDAVRALNAEANRCLAELAPGAEVSITGGTSIGISVTGLGGARSYEDASAGERCRLDVAMLLAIAAIAPPTELPLVFDDVFGTLDEDGIDAAARLLLQVGLERRVVVITQLDSLVARMRGAAQVVSL